MIWRMKEIVAIDIRTCIIFTLDTLHRERSLLNTAAPEKDPWKDKTGIQIFVSIKQ